jgi:N,N'-diacetylchitobiose transport system substrate-binding protein
MPKNPSVAVSTEPTIASRSNLSRRQFLRGSAISTGVLLLAACAPVTAPAGDAGGAAPAAAAVPLTVWTSQTFTTDADALQDEQINTWAAENNVEMELSRFAGDATRPNWQAAFESRQFPDVGNLPQEDLAKFILTNSLLETTEIVTELNELEGGYTAGAFSAGRTSDGKHWSLPSFSSTEMFYVRTDKLEEVGMELPETWDDVRAIADAINAPDDLFWGWGAQIGTPSWDSEVAFTSMLWSYGGKTWDEESMPAINSPETRLVLDFMKDAWDAGVIPPDAPTWDDSGNNRAYQTSIVGMIFNTGSVLRYMQTDDPALLEISAVLPIPAGPAGRFVSGYHYQWGAFSTTEQPELSLSLLEYLMRPEQLRPYYDAGGGNLLPVFLGMYQDEMWQDPYRKVLADMIPNTYPQGYPGLTTPWVLDAWIDHTMAKMLNRVLIDGWENDAAVEEAEAALQTWYDDWQGRLSS